MTTEQFVEAFEKRELPGTLYDDLVQCFRHADMVKFARQTPERSRTETDFELVHGMIENVRADFERRQNEAETTKMTPGTTGLSQPSQTEEEVIS